MTVNIYLCYYDTRVINGHNQYYFRAVFLPASLKGEVLLFLLDRLAQIDLDDYFDLEVIPAPDIISEGSEIYAFNGGAGGIFTAPCDLHRLMLVDYPAFNASFAAYRSNRAPWVIYTELHLENVTASDVPEPMHSLIPEHGHTYTPANPDDFVLREYVVCQTGRTGYGPADVIPTLLWAYQGMVEQAFPSNSNYEHVTNPAAFDGSTGETWTWIIQFSGHLSGIFPGSSVEKNSATVRLFTNRENAGVQSYFLHCPHNIWTWVANVGYNWTTSAYPFTARVRFYEPKEDKPVVVFDKDFSPQPSTILPGGRRKRRTSDKGFSVTGFDDRVWRGQGFLTDNVYRSFAEGLNP